MTVEALPLLPLAVAAAGLPLFVWSALGDEIAMPRLAGTFWLTGATLVALSVVGAWSQVRWRPLALPLALLGAVLLTSVVATAFGTDPIRSLLGEYLRYQGLLPLFLYAALMLAAMVAVAYADTARPLLVGVFIGGVLSAAYGALQWMDLDWVTWGGVPAGQIGGAFAQPEVLGIELVVAAAASTALLWSDDTRARIVVGAGIALMLFVVMLSLSRGAWVAAFAAAIALGAMHFELLRSWRSRWWYALPVAAVVAAAVLAVPQGRDTLGSAWKRMGSARSFTDTSVSQRIGLWKLSFEMAADHPVVGAGPDAFPQLFADYRTQDQPGYHTRNARPESSHNIFLDRLVDTGVLGTAAFLALLGASAWVGWRALLRAEGMRRAQLAGLLAALAGYYAATFFYYAESATGWLPWLLLGALFGLAAATPGAEEGAGWRFSLDWPGWRAVAPIAAGTLGVVLVAGGLVLVYADYNSGRALESIRRGDVQGAIDHTRTATRWNPLHPRYLEALGSYREVAAQQGRRDQARPALDAFHRLNTRFEPTAFSLTREAEAQANVAFETQEDKERVFALLERAVEADPNNYDVRQGVADFYSSVGETGRAAPHLAWLEQARAAGDAPAP